MPGAGPQSWLEPLARGGPVMFVLAGFSLAATSIVLFKFAQFFALGLRRTASVEEAVTLAERGRAQEALALLEKSCHPAAPVVAGAVEAAVSDRLDAQAAEAEVARLGGAQVRRLESWLRALSGLAHLSPLLGLLGTVLGMIEAFMRVEQAGSAVDPAILSGGIWQALLTTAYGLTIAIPSMAAFYILEGEVDRVRAVMRDACVRVLVRYGKASVAASGPADTAAVVATYEV